MAGLFNDGGYFMYPITFLALGGLVLAVLQLVHRGRRSYAQPFWSISAATAALAVAAFSIGMYQATDVVATQAPGDMQLTMFVAAFGIAGVPVFWAAGWLAINVVVGGVAMFVHQHASARARRVG